MEKKDKPDNKLQPLIESINDSTHKIHTHSSAPKHEYHPFYIYKHLTIFAFFSLITFLILLSIGYMSLLSKTNNKKLAPKNSSTPPQQIACTQDAKQCPDGSYVNRTGPNCEFAPCPTSNLDQTANWKTYTDKEGLFKISYPPSWSETASQGMLTLGENRIDISIIVWNNGTKQYAENLWRQIDCAPGNDPNSGCSPLPNNEEKKLSLNDYTVYFNVDGRNQMHAYIPNASKNKTVEIYSIYLTDKKLFNQILSTFKFLE